MFYVCLLFPKIIKHEQDPTIFEECSTVKEQINNEISDDIKQDTFCMNIQDKNTVVKRVLENGMTILVKPSHSLPRVSCQIWYGVGSKDEEAGERGIAHLIEHMIFKGTSGKDSLNLSESDINIITHVLSGNCNAFTSYDYTGYLFNFPARNWAQALPVMADCMTNCSFKEEHLNSEMKAVIQELKMGRDDYTRSVVMAMISSIFPDHPYHHPIIGYKQDLWSVHDSNLMAFYKKHYVPNNATLVVVGDVIPEEVFEQSKKYFEAIPADESYEKKEFYFNQDLATKSVTLFRDIKQPTVIFSWVIPGITAGTTAAVDIVSLLLGDGKGSRLYKKIVDQQELATSLSSFAWDLFDHTIFMVAFEPITMVKVDTITQVIHEEIASIAREGVVEREIKRAVNKARMRRYSVLEDIEQQAYEIGQYFVAMQDENYAFTYLDKDPEILAQAARTLLADYCVPSLMHSGTVLPLKEEDKQRWDDLQHASDREDQRILSARVRTSPVEDASYANAIKPHPVEKFDFPKAQQSKLSNGSRLLYSHNPNVPKIEVVVRLKAEPYYDSEEHPGLYVFAASILKEGTKNYSATELADELETLGMSVSTSPGRITMSMLSANLERGLELLEEILSRPAFDKKEIEKVRGQLITALKNFWDEPRSFSGQLVREHVYKNHPFSKNGLGTQDSLKSIEQKHLIECHKKFITPQEATIAIVGDFSGYDIPEVFERVLGKWTGKDVKTIEFPALAPTQEKEIVHTINRDQVVLSFAGLSVDRKDPDYDNLLVFDQIFGGGALGSMSSRLFQLREQTGLFYTINGSFTSQSSEQPGMFFVKTIVSLDRLQEAEKAITGLLHSVVETLTEQDIVDAKNAILNALIARFETNRSVAQSFLFLDKYDFAADYFDNRAVMLKSVTLESVKNAVKRVMENSKFATFRVGRIEQEIEKEDKIK